QRGRGRRLDDQGRSRGRADRDRDLHGDRALAGRRRPDHEEDDRADPGEGGGARRGSGDAPRTPAGRSEGSGDAAADRTETRRAEAGEVGLILIASGGLRGELPRLRLVNLPAATPHPAEALIQHLTPST